MGLLHLFGVVLFLSVVIAFDLKDFSLKMKRLHKKALSGEPLLTVANKPNQAVGFFAWLKRCSINAAEKEIDKANSEIMKLIEALPRLRSELDAMRRDYENSQFCGDITFGRGNFCEYLIHEAKGQKSISLNDDLKEFETKLVDIRKVYDRERALLDREVPAVLYIFPAWHDIRGLALLCARIQSTIRSPKSEFRRSERVCIALQHLIKKDAGFCPSEGLALLPGEMALGRWNCAFYKVHTHTTTIRNSKKNAFLWLATTESFSDFAASSRTLSRSQRFYLESEGAFYCTSERMVFIGNTATRMFNWKQVMRIEFDYDKHRILIHSTNHQAPSLFCGVDAKSLDILQTFITNRNMRTMISTIAQKDLCRYLSEMFKGDKSIALNEGKIISED